MVWTNSALMSVSLVVLFILSYDAIDVEISSDRTALKSNAYNLVPADVTDTQVLHSKLQDVGVSIHSIHQ